MSSVKYSSLLVSVCRCKSCPRTQWGVWEGIEWEQGPSQHFRPSRFRNVGGEGEERCAVAISCESVPLRLCADILAGGRSQVKGRMCERRKPQGLCNRFVITIIG